MIIQGNDPYTGASFTLLNRVRRQIWNTVWLIFFRPSASLLHGWRNLLLKVFGARIGRYVHIHPSLGGTIANFDRWLAASREVMGQRLLASQSFWLYRANEAVTTYGTSSPPDNGEERGQRYLAENPQLEGKRVVLFLSRIHEKKGCDLLLDAFAQVASKDDRLHLVIAGPDQSGWTAALQARAERLGIAESVSWSGMLQGDAKWGAFYAADAFCLPSHQENFGIVVAEALACGKPVLITNKVNIWREMDADNAGFVDEDTKEGTLRNLQRFLALDSREYTAMCRRAKNCFNERFHINQAGQRLIEIVRENAACTL